MTNESISSDTTVDPAQQTKADRIAFWTCLPLIVAGSIAFIFLQYATPASVLQLRNDDAVGLALFKAHFGLPDMGLNYAQFTQIYTLVLVALSGLALCCAVAGLNIDARHRRTVLAIVAALSISFALAYPPVQSMDVFNYAALARMYAYYHLNPYVQSTRALIPYHDSSVPIIGKGFWVTSPYGPLWTFLSAGMVLVSTPASFFVQAIILKLIEAGALIAASATAAAYSARRNPRFAIPSMIAVGLNPVCLMEGPGNGHNDALMIAVFLAALNLYDLGKFKRAALAAGLAIAIKLMPLVVLPWIVINHATTKSRMKLTDLCAIALLLIGPTVVLMAPFWDHGASVLGLLSRIQDTHTASSYSQLLNPESHAKPSPFSRVTQVAASKGGILLLFAAITALLIWRRRFMEIPVLRRLAEACATPGSYPAWLICMVLFLTLAAFSERKSAEFWVSWYSLWSLAPVGCIWTKRGSPLLVWAMILALTQALRYAPFVA